MVSDMTKPLTMMKELNLKSNVAFSIIHQSLNHRVSYLSRTLESDYARSALVTFDTKIDEALGGILSFQPRADYEQEAFNTQRSLPPDLGGLGVVRHSWVGGDVARLRSRVLFNTFTNKYFNKCATDYPSSGSHVVIGLLNNPMGYYAAEPGLNPLPALPNPKEITSSAEGTLTHTSSALLDRLAEEDPAKAAWYRSLRFSTSGSWLRPPIGIYVPRKSSLLGNEFKIAARLRMMLGPEAATVNELCVCDARPPIYRSNPTHFIDCNLAKTHFHVRHNDVAEHVSKFIKKIHPMSLVVQEKMLPTGAKMDIYTCINNVEYFIDIAIVDPASQTHRAEAARKDEVAAVVRAAQKRQKYEDTLRLASPGAIFVPFIVEATGRVAAEAIKFLERVVISATLPGLTLVRSRPPFHPLLKQIGASVSRNNSFIVADASDRVVKARGRV
jgi:hypothetical protein